MIRVYTNTKRGQDLLNRANRYEGDTLESVYTSYSTKKAHIYNAIRAFYCTDNGSTNFRICSHNTCFFTCAYDTVTETGDRATVYFTPSNTYLIITG